MIRLNVLVMLFLSSLLSAQTSLDTLALFPDTTTFQSRGTTWVDDVVGWGVRFHLDSTKEYSIKSIIVMGNPGIPISNPVKTWFWISTGNLPEDSVIYKSDIELTGGYPSWQTIILDNPVKIKEKSNFYITGTLLLYLAPSTDYKKAILDQFTLRDRNPLFIWYEGIPFYFAIKAVLEGQTSGVDHNGDQKVRTYGLSQNYPNPFNPSTVINFEIPQASKVSLKVYNMLGKEMATLVNGYKEMGRYSVQFNAKDLPSGMYIYEIRANSFIRSGKMLLLK